MKPVALITGAGRGIGRATARLLAQRDYFVCLASRTEAELHETAETIGEQSMILPLNVTDAAAVTAAVARIDQQFGRLDAVINCAGVAPLLPIEQTTPAIWQNVMNTNLSAAYFVCYAAWPIFRRQRRGVIVNVSSEAARDPFEGFSAYGAAKAGLNSLGKSLAREGASIGVRVHTVAPAAVETAMFRKLLSPAQFPTDQTLSPTDVADLIVQCIAGDLRHTSGEVIYLHRQTTETARTEPA